MENPTSEAASGDEPVVTTDTNQQKASLVLLDHTGVNRFVLPFKDCKTWSGFKYFLAFIYANAADELRNKIEKEEFAISTVDDELVMPAVWEFVIGSLPSRNKDKLDDLKLMFWSSPFPAKLDRDNHRRSTFDNEDAGYTVNPTGPETRRDRRSSWTSEQRVTADVLEAEQKLLEARVRETLFTERKNMNSREKRSRPREYVEERRHPRWRSRESAVSSEIIEANVEIDDDSEDAAEDSSALSEDEEGIEPVVILPPPRNILTPVDNDGNPLSFIAETKWVSPLDKEVDGAKVAETTKSRDVREMKMENLKILKTVSSIMESRTTIQLHTLPGPESVVTAENVDVRWYHLHGDQLDFANFKNTCLNAQGLSERLKRLTAKTLEKVEKEKLKAFLDGMFIEPGTVLRGDEKDHTDLPSVIFSCIPHFDTNPPFKFSAGRPDRLHPPRSLMQSYYPYESVRERDMEQVFRKFTNDSTNRIIQVPTMWMMNIGTHAVVTCGYQPLTSEFVKSITVVQEDTKMLGTKDANNLLNIRLTDWDGRVLLYSPVECQSYFEMEQKLRESRYLTRCGAQATSLHMAWNTQESETIVTPGNWLSILNSRKPVFINLRIMDAGEWDKKLNSPKANEAPVSNTSPNSIPPFFRWPLPTKADPKFEDTAISATVQATSTEKTDKKLSEQTGSVPPEFQRSIHCLEQVEKAMLTETIPDFDADHVIDKTFTTTKYYQSLPEATYKDIKNSFFSLTQTMTVLGTGSADRTLHQVITDTQYSTLATKTSDIIDSMCRTLKLFVVDVDETTMLRKVWGAGKSMATIVSKIRNRCDRKPDPAEFTDPDWKAPKTGNRQWAVRNPRSDSVKRGFIQFPKENSELAQSIRKCKSCRHTKIYADPQAALEHLEAHLKPDVGQKMKLMDWIENDEQRLVEETNAGYLAIVTQASDAAMVLLAETQQLAEGVQSEQGKISGLYTLPHELLKTLRRVIVFYLAIERALHHTELGFEEGYPERDEEDVPFSNMGLDVLNRFCESAKMSVLAARKELCFMARGPVPEDYSKRLDLSPQYLCSWFMRRLLVKPLTNSMTAADIYREYLSTLQFQVNHRPGKRLLRSINLLQEELAALQQVNEWQTKLIQSYISVLDDRTYQSDVPSRRSYFDFEKPLLESCLDNLADTRDDYTEMIRRCGPLSESTKQSAEINEEDHGKAIFVFTVVTVIFMPLSFVTSYLGMNTADIRDMDNKQGLFWEIALPLTAVTMLSILYLAYNGDDLRDVVSSLYKRLTGKQDSSSSARGISVAQRKRAQKNPTDSSSTVDYKSLADEAEFAPPRQTTFPSGRREFRNRTDFLDVIAPAANNYDPYDYPPPAPPIRAKIDTGAGYGETSTYGYNPGRRAPRPPPTLRSAAPLRPDPQRSTYMRIARKHVDQETLEEFGIPWEIDDTDPDYYLLLTYLNEQQTDELFEDTKRRREGRGGRGGRTFDHYGDTVHYTDNVPYGGEENYGGYKRGGREKPKEYEWVRKRKPSGRDYRRTGRSGRMNMGSYIPGI